MRTLTYFDDTKETHIITDAGPEGIAGVLVQEDPKYKSRSILAYFSRAF